MRFFTPELYRRFNSADDEEADRADEAWEEVLRTYRAHLDALRDRMPSPVRHLSELCLHDAELLAREQVIEPFFPSPPDATGAIPAWSALAILSVKREYQIVTLIYALWDRVRESRLVEDWPFSAARTHWLYDEIDVTPAGGGFVHRVLFSDGTVIEIPFASVLIHTLPLPVAAERNTPRQSA